MKRLNAVLSAIFLVYALTSCGGGGGGGGSTNPPPGGGNTGGGSGSTLRITSTTLPGGILGQPYTGKLAATGGKEPYTWSGILFQGVELSADGTITANVPTWFPGDLPLFVTVTDSSTPAKSVDAQVTLPMFGISSNTTLDLGRMGQFYSDEIQAMGGTGTIHWTVSGSLPPGITGAPFSSTITYQWNLNGWPAEVGSYPFRITATDSGSPVRSFSADFVLNISARALQLSTASLKPAVVGQSYSHQFVTSGGGTPFTWQISSGSLPDGLQLNTGNGTITGTPTAAGYSSFQVTVQDSSAPSSQVAVGDFWMLVTSSALAKRNNSLTTATPIVFGEYYASISPFGDPIGVADPDEDYFTMTASGGSFIRIGIDGSTRRNPDIRYSNLDPVIEILDSNGQRFSTCNDPYDDFPPSELPITADATVNGYDDPCMNMSRDGGITTGLGASLTIKVPGTGSVPIYFHVFDYWGNARPDMFYRMTIQKP